MTAVSSAGGRPSSAGWADAFGPLTGRVWLDTAFQGALPLPAQRAAAEAVGWKTRPWEMTGERFADVPEGLRRALARMIHADDGDLVLANGASYGLHLLANGIPWRDGDEVLVMRGDFPSNILPWMGLADRGVSVRALVPTGAVVDAEAVAAAIRPRTRLVCLSWVHSFSGHAIDLAAVGGVCRERGVVFVANAAQAIGVRPLDVTTAPVDAVVGVGWKWLCGPYGTGFAWLRSSLRQILRYNHMYWLSVLASDDLGAESLDLTLRDDTDARRFDVFGAASFFNVVPFAAAVDHLSAIGVEPIRRHVDALVQRLIDGLDHDLYTLISPESGPARSTLVVVSHRDRSRNPVVRDALQAAGIDIALRAGALRISPHLYTTGDQIDRALSALARAGALDGGHARPINR